MAMESQMVDLQSPMPAFELPDLTGATVTSRSFAGAPLLVAFMGNHCPYAKHVEAGFGEHEGEELRGLLMPDARAAHTGVDLDVDLRATVTSTDERGERLRFRDGVQGDVESQRDGARQLVW